MSEYHVASFIVRCHARHLPEVTAQIQQMPGTEVHGQDAKGRVIVTIEGANHGAIADQTEQVRLIPNVVDVAAVYHEYAPAT